MYPYIWFNTYIFTKTQRKFTIKPTVTIYRAMGIGVFIFFLLFSFPKVHK